jgi:hypothetical protein
MMLMVLMVYLLSLFEKERVDSSTIPGAPHGDFDVLDQFCLSGTWAGSRCPAGPAGFRLQVFGSLHANEAEEDLLGACHREPTAIQGDLVPAAVGEPAPFPGSCESSVMGTTLARTIGECP